MVKNLLNYLKSKKFLDMFCYIFFGLYIFYAIAFVAVDFSNNKNMELKFESMLAYASEVNKKLEADKIINSKKNDEDFSQEQLFFNGEDAIISSYDKFYNSNSFYMSGDGNLSVVAMGVDIKVKMNVVYVRFNPDKVYEEGTNKVTYASAFQSTVENNTNKAHKYLRESSITTSIETTKYYSDGNPDYSGLTPKNDDSPILPDNLFLINNETIKNISYFKVKQTKKGLNYYVQLSIDCEKALEKFSIYMQKSADTLEPVSFSKFTLTACIDSSGKPTSINVIADCVLHMSMMGGIYAQTNINLTLTISGINETINYPINL